MKYKNAAKVSKVSQDGRIRFHDSVGGLIGEQLAGAPPNEAQGR
jgi:hypothetical protein